MIYGFDTDNADYATAALLVYAVYRSRNRSQFKVTPDMWGQIERFTKSSAKRARTIPEFLESFKTRMRCPTIHPRAMAVGLHGEIPLVSNDHGELMQIAAPEDQREFLTNVLHAADEPAVIAALYRETTWIILLVRDRLEREKPIEARFETALDEIGAS